MTDLQDRAGFAVDVIFQARVKVALVAIGGWVRGVQGIVPLPLLDDPTPEQIRLAQNFLDHPDAWALRVALGLATLPDTGSGDTTKDPLVSDLAILNGVIKLLPALIAATTA